MSTLASLQKLFLSSLQDEEASIAFAKKLIGQLPETQKRLAIYQDSIEAGFIYALSETYPVIKKLLGDACFYSFCRYYIERNRSLSPDLNEYGMAFADELMRHPLSVHYPYLADCARLDLAWNQANLSAADRALDYEKLSLAMQEASGAMCFLLQDDATLLSSPYPIMRIWEVNQCDADAQDEINLSAGGDDLIVWRHEWTVRMDRLTSEEFLLLSCFKQGLSLDDIADYYPELDLTALLPQLASKGYFADFVIVNKKVA